MFNICVYIEVGIIPISIKLKEKKRFQGHSVMKPFLDNDNILRVGCRLSNATDLTYDYRYPIMIPRACHFDT